RTAGGRATLQRALSLQRAEVIERRARRHSKPPADLPDGGRQPVRDRERADEVQDLLLPAGELPHSQPPRSAPTYSTDVEEARKEFDQITRAPTARTPGTSSDRRPWRPPSASSRPDPPEGSGPPRRNRDDEASESRAVSSTARSARRRRRPLPRDQSPA